MLFILNRQEKVVGVLKNSGKNSVPFFNDLLTEDLATGSETFEFTTVSRNGIGQHLVVGNFIAFKKGTSYKLFQIMQTEEDHQEELYITVYAECAGLQLINSVFRGVKIVSASFERVMQTLLSDTSWNVGILPYGLATTYDLDIEQASVYSLLQTYAQQYGVELEFRVELNRGKISKKYIDGYYNRGKVTGKRFTYERDIEGIIRKTDATELYTALIGRGNNEISFKDVTVDGIDKPMGQDFVANQSAYEKYNNNGYHIVGIYECDTDDAKDLLRKTHKHLLEVSEPKVEYDISVLLLCELLGEKWNEVAIGDTISVFDNAFYPPIMVSARVSKLQTSMTDKNANKCTLANFIEVKSNITSEMRKIASQLQGYVDNRFPIGSSDIQDGAVGMDKISDIYTQTITTDILKAGKVETEKLIAQEAEITNAKIENLKAGFIEADKIITDTIVANKAEFDKLEAKVGKIDTLVSGNISSENIQTGGITGSNLNMDTIFVKDANILDLSASKLTAGEINTSKVVISSADGGMRLVGSTQQFVDENNRIRIQLGKDANGDFDFYILAENGDILFNTRGITGNAIENGLIKENMVSDGAIGGKKINWSSFVTEFNKDSNTHKLNSSKVLLDGTNQTLDIHFNRLNSTVNDNVNKTESNTTQLNVHQGKINTLIQDTTITKDGKNVKLKDEYSKLEQTVGGLKSTVGEQQTTINQNTGKITATESKVSTLEQTVNGFNSELSHVKTTIDEQEEAINSVNSALSGKANSNDVYKKSETMTTSAINSAINQSADSIKLGISNTYETKSNVESKISSANTSTLNSAKSYADTKKSEAITQAGKDADSKVNSAKNELNTAINKKANSVDVYTKTETYTKAQTDSAIKVAKDEITLGVSNTYETKTNVETKVNNAVNNIQIGGRNLFLNSGFTKGLNYWYTYNCSNPQTVADSSALSGYAVKFTSTGGGIYQRKGGASNNPTNYPNGSVMTVSGYVKSSVAGKVLRQNFENAGANTSKNITCTNANTWYYFTHTYTITSHGFNTITFYGDSGADYYLKDVILEYGNKASTWTSAPEDVDSAINSKANTTDVYKKSETYTKSETDSKINIAKDNIELGVKNTYETKSNVETKVNNAVNNIQIGGRNLWIEKNLINAYESNGNATSSTSQHKMMNTYTDLNGAKYVTVQLWNPNSFNNTSNSNRIAFYDSSKKWISSIGTPKPNGTTYVSGIITVPTNAKYMKIGMVTGDSQHESSIRIKVELGNKPSDWTPAPEDVDSAIDSKANSTDVYKKSETYTKSETDSKINVAKDDITLSVSNTYETKSNVESKVSSTLSSAKSYADTKKTEAINSANSSTDTKLKSYSTTTQMNSAIQVAKDSITNTVASTYATKGDVSNTYATKSSLTQTTNNITAKFEASGGSNLVKNGAFKNGTAYWTKWGSPSSYEVNNSVNGYGQELRIVTTGSDQGAYQTIEGLRTGIPHTVVADVWVGSGTCLIYINIGTTWWLSSLSSGTGWKKLSITFTPTSSTVKLLIGRGLEGANGDYRFTGIRMYEGEAIQAWTPHHSEVYNGSTVIDASGVTVNNGALRVKNNAGKTVLEGDSNGNLVLSGTLKSESSNGLYASLSSGGLTLRDSQKSEEVLRLNTSFFASNRDMNGVTFAMPQYSDFIRFSHIDKPSLESGWSSSNTQYNFMDFWSSNQTVGGVSYKKGINVYSPMYVNNGIQLFSGTDFPSEVLGAVSWNNGNGTIWNMMGLYGDNGAVLGYKSGSNLQARILVSEASHPGTGDNIKSWGNWNLSGHTIHQGTFSGSHVNSYSNPVTRTYTSTYCIESENKQVRINLENIQITDGKAIINIPNKYVGINNGYIVSSIVKKGKGDVWVAKETENRFTLEATDDIKVNVEIIIKLEESASYELKTADDTQVCIDMSTGQPIV